MPSASKPQTRQGLPAGPPLPDPTRCLPHPTFLPTARLSCRTPTVDPLKERPGVRHAVTGNTDRVLGGT